MSPSALRFRLLLIVMLAALALVVLSEAGASVAGQPPVCSASLFGGPPGPDGRFPAEAGEAERGGISCSDDEGVTPTLSVVGQPSHGTLSALQQFPGSPGFRSASFTYTPNADYRGPDQFTLRGSDGTTDTDVVVRVNVVDPVNDQPVCFASVAGGPPGPDGRFPAEAGEAERGNIGCSDDEGADLTFSVLHGPAHGALSQLLESPPFGGFESASFTYTSEPDYRGEDQFTLRVSDGTHDIDRVIRLNVVDPVNEPPECFVPGTIPVEQGQTLIFAAEPACFDPEGEPLTLTITDQPDHGPAIAGPDEDGFFTYTAPTDYLGPDSFGVEISDGVNTIPGTVNIQVTEFVNDPGGGPGGGAGGGGAGGGGGAAGGGGAGGGGGLGGGAGAGEPTLDEVIASVAKEATQAAKALRRCGTTGLLRKTGCTDNLTAIVNGTVLYRVTAPAGRAGAAAATVLARGRKAIPTAGTYPVKIKATQKGRKRLRNARKLNARLTVKFTDSKGNVATRSKNVVLKRKKK